MACTYQEGVLDDGRLADGNQGGGKGHAEDGKGCHGELPHGSSNEQNLVLLTKPGLQRLDDLLRPVSRSLYIPVGS